MSELPSGDPHRVPPQTTPVWQTELLLSGGVVFALLQLPPLIDATASWWRPRLDESLLQVIVYAQLYARLVVASLGFAFVLHLAIRGWWIAEVGLNSIFPAGPNLERSVSGPNARRLRAEMLRPSAERIESADNFATLVFVAGSAMAAMSVAVGVVTLSLAAAAAGLGWILGTPERSVDYMVAAFLIIFLPGMLATLLDQAFGRWIGTETRLAALIRALIRSGELLLMSRIWSPMLLTLIGSARTAWRGWTVASLVYFCLLSLIAVQIAGGSAVQRLFPGTTVFPGEPSPLVLDSRHYADQRRGTERFSLQPYLASRLVESDWLALTVPLDPRRDTVLLQERCPDLVSGRAAEKAPIDTADQAVESRHLRLRDCLDQLRPVQLNGQRVPATRAQFYRTEKGDLPALLYMIPIEALAAERHQIRVGRPASPEGASSERASPHGADDWTIPFWRQPER